MKRSTIFFIVIFIVLEACQLEIDVNSDKKTTGDNLMKVDLGFSAFSEAHGFRAALMQYADTSAVLLRPGEAPVTGILSIAEYLEDMNDRNIRVTWEPRGGMLSKSKDLGYTFGIYTIVHEGEEKKGTYATVWRKNEKGEWKYVLDTGNEGIQ